MLFRTLIERKFLFTLLISIIVSIVATPNFASYILMDRKDFEVQADQGRTPYQAKKIYLFSSSKGFHKRDMAVTI